MRRGLGNGFVQGPEKKGKGGIIAAYNFMTGACKGAAATLLGNVQ